MDKDYYVCLTGAKKNVGDFLITERALMLLKNVAPEYNYDVLPHWETLDDRLKYVNASRGIIILGGPGYQTMLYPNVYKLCTDLDDIKVPIYIMGGGWNAMPGTSSTEKIYKFNSSARKLLDKASTKSTGLSCRDMQTKRVLKKNKYDNVTMTGCPVWYDLESLNMPLQAPKQIKNIVITLAQKKFYYNQSIYLMEYLYEKYPEANIIVSFHRGISEEDEYTSVSEIENATKLAVRAKELGFKVVDTSFSTDKIKFYDECDLHIGYRVHAHIYFLSKRLPSILIHEDSRGTGATETLKAPGIDGYATHRTYDFLSKGISVLNNTFLSNFFRRIYGRFGLKTNSNIIEEISLILEELEAGNYDGFKDTINIIDEHYYVMKEFIEKMTCKER